VYRKVPGVQIPLSPLIDKAVIADRWLPFVLRQAIDDSDIRLAELEPQKLQESRG
jgi:hypothetical protein